MRLCVFLIVFFLFSYPSEAMIPPAKIVVMPPKKLKPIALFRYS